MAEVYTILHKGKVLYKNLTEEEYFDMMEDLSIDYYQTGSPRPQDLETKGGGYVEGAPKKTRQGAGSHTKYAPTSRNKARKKYRGQGKG